MKYFQQRGLLSKQFRSLKEHKAACEVTNILITAGNSYYPHGQKNKREEEEVGKPEPSCSCNSGETQEILVPKKSVT